jgi:hypothetical protein
LRPHYESGANQLPAVIESLAHLGPTLSGQRYDQTAVSILQARSWLFRLPSQHFVVGLSVDFDSPLRSCIPLLEDCYYGDCLIGESRLIETIATATTDRGVRALLEGAELGTHGHQVLFVGASGDGLVTSSRRGKRVDEDLVRRLIYRVDQPYAQGVGSIRFPSEPNRSNSSLAACGPYVTVIAGQQDYLENGMMLAAVQLVGAQSLVMQTRHAAYEALERLRTIQKTADRAGGGARSHRELRRELAAMSERVGRLEVDLSFGVEAYEEVASVVPSMRLNEFHRELFLAAQVPRESASVGQMLERLSSAVAAERSSVATLERRRDERRRLLWGILIGFVSFVAIPLNLTFAFFAVSTNEVTPGTSLFDFSRYLGYYISLGSLVLVSILLALGVWFFTRERE